MSAPPEIGTLGERPEMGAAMALERRREANSIAILERQADLATLTDDEFERRLAQAKKGYERLQRIFDTLMVEGVHYNTKTKSGGNAFPSPDLTMEGADLLRTQFRLIPERVGEPEIIADPDFVSVTVTLQLRDMVGRVVAVRSGCCTSAEGRFYERPRSRGRSDQAAPPIGESPDAELEDVPDVQALKAEKRGRPLYSDAREVLHQCTAMAEKRAAKLATATATGITAFLKNKGRERMRGAIASGAVQWSEEEKQKVYAAAKRAGIKTHGTLRHVVVTAVGHEPPTSGEEVLRVLAALALWTPEAQGKESLSKRAPMRDRDDPYARPGTAAAAATVPGAAAQATEPGDAAEGELALDQRAAGEDRLGLAGEEG